MRFVWFVLRKFPATLGFFFEQNLIADFPLGTGKTWGGPSLANSGDRLY